MFHSKHYTQHPRTLFDLQLHEFFRMKEMRSYMLILHARISSNGVPRNKGTKHDVYILRGRKKNSFPTQ